VAVLKVELGGGLTPRGEGYLNVDRLPSADVVLDLDSAPLRLPWGDGEVAALYTSHALEHLRNPEAVLREVTRVCRVGAPVEVRVPHWLHPMACCNGHTHVISDRQVRLWDSQPHHWFRGAGKRLALRSVHYQPDVELAEARRLFPHLAPLTDEQVMRFVPGTCHEVRYLMEVVPYDG
jgi:ubiquinone/menaquinone biosynthesis C-methylase UbiE